MRGFRFYDIVQQNDRDLTLGESHNLFNYSDHGHDICVKIIMSLTNLHSSVAFVVRGTVRTAN